MEYCKLQVCCLILVLCIAFIYCREFRRVKRKHRFNLFDGMLILGVVMIVFDGTTAYTVNYLDQVPGWLNKAAHLIFLISIDAFEFMGFLYMLVMTEGIPRAKGKLWFLFSPFIINVAVLVFFIDSLEYRIGKVTNYSMGISVYTCFAMVAIYTLFTIILFAGRWRYIESHKRASIALYLLTTVGVTVYQMCVPEALMTSLVPTIMILCVYMNQENPVISELSHYQHEMVMGFATLVEKRDDNTGGHIKRTSLYVELLAKELRRRGYYKNILTKDYINNLRMAAPMHDIGKISVPDAILQKPGKLTDEEFEEMKLHAPNGGRIIKETFGKMENVEYRDMAYQVAMYHHEKWNGRGYPKGLEEKEIPLCARIMAIADVFDAVSEKRCYRDAMPMDQCFEIIREGSGRDFEPQLVEVFLDIREEIEALHDSVS